MNEALYPCGCVTRGVLRTAVHLYNRRAWMVMSVTTPPRSVAGRAGMSAIAALFFLARLL